MGLTKSDPHNYPEAKEVYFHHKDPNGQYIATFLNAGGNMEMSSWSIEDGEPYVWFSRIYKNIRVDQLIYRAKVIAGLE